MLLSLLLGGVTVVLNPEAEVLGSTIEVAEVAVVTGGDEALLERVRAASLGYAPAPGYQRLLPSNRVAAELRRALPGVEVQLTGARELRVRPKVQVLEAEQLWTAAEAVIEGLIEGQSASIKRASHVPDLTLPAGLTPPEVRASVFDRTLRPGTQVATTQVWVDGELFRTVSLSFDVALRETRTVLARAVAAGEVLTPAHFEQREVEVRPGPEQYALRLDQLQGVAAVRAIAAGAVVTERDVKRRIVMHRGQLVTVRVSSGSVTADATGTVQQDGRYGEQVHVQLQKSGRRVAGRVRGPELVEISLR